MAPWLLLFAACVPSAPEAPASAPRAEVTDCAQPARRPLAPLSPDPVLPDTAVAQLAGLGRPAGPPLDLTLVLDRSGSMAEEGRMGFVKRAILRMVEGFRPGDRLNVVVFDNEACAALVDWNAGRDDVGVVHDVVAAIAPRGSTDLALGLHAGYRVATRADWLADAARDRRMVLVTDALLDEQDVAETTLHEVRRAREIHAIHLHTSSVGQRADSTLLPHLADLGGGEWRYLGAAAWTTSRRERSPEPDLR